MFFASFISQYFYEKCWATDNFSCGIKKLLSKNYHQNKFKYFRLNFTLKDKILKPSL